MRRAARLCALIALALALPGCVVVLGVKDVPDCRQVVEIDGEWYIVDAKHHKLTKVEIHDRDESGDAVGEPSSGD